jgi:hypothetical protein
VGGRMLKRLKYTLKFFFVSPKPKIVETRYIKEKKSWKINYNKYYSKKDKFILNMWAITMLTFIIECMIYVFILFWDSLIKLVFLPPMIFFYILYMKNSSKMKDKYRERAIEEGQYGR